MAPPWESAPAGFWPSATRSAPTSAPAGWARSSSPSIGCANEEIAVKVLLPHLLADPKALERFLNEAKIASNLSHADIVRVYDLQQAPALTFLTMELLKGHNLREEIAQRTRTARRFTVAEVGAMAAQLCAALQFAHRVTVHRDVKPENIWLCEDGTLKLMDFGIARLLRPSQFTSTGLALGTAYYMAPEQLRGQEVDHRADQFSLAVVLYELLTGEIPQGVIKSPQQLRRNLPPRMSQAIMKALEARPDSRHADMAALARALEARSATGIGTRAAMTVATARPTGCRRHIFYLAILDSAAQQKHPSSARHRARCQSRCRRGRLPQATGRSGRPQEASRSNPRPGRSRSEKIPGRVDRPSRRPLAAPPSGQEMAAGSRKTRRQRQDNGGKKLVRPGRS